MILVLRAPFSLAVGCVKIAAHLASAFTLLSKRVKLRFSYSRIFQGMEAWRETFAAIT
ncbi:MAG TPA: hypothetical protein VKW08_08545 [Xanthobacteraceae bacterium]|nr:hypothetical protein [Xanthobacteraceae bacterium]